MKDKYDVPYGNISIIDKLDAKVGAPKKAFETAYKVPCPAKCSRVSVATSPRGTFNQSGSPRFY